LIRLKTHPGYASGIKEKRDLSGRGMDMIVVLEFRKRKEFVPVVLALIDKDTEILFEFLIDPLRLSVSLRVVCRGSRQFDSEKTV
jgi:hypothetical protein